MIKHSRVLAAIPGLEHGFQSADVKPPVGLIHCHQVHSDVVIVARHGGDAEETASMKADGLLTRDSGIVVGVQTADCLPVLFASHDGKEVAAIHAGWRGLEKGILKKTIDKFAEFHVPASNLVVAIGPGIGQCCYEVDMTTAQSFESAWGHLWGPQKPWRHEARAPHGKSGKPEAKSNGNNLWIDLDRIATLQLESFGVPRPQIEDVGGCTYCAIPGFASYRRACHEKPAEAPKPLVGRQWSWICIRI